MTLLNDIKNPGRLYTGPWYLYYYLIKELWAMSGRLLQQRVHKF
jgi:hypothetical protein